ncbi:hypothetical protein BCR35DRAFT_301539 [Leucosporidium creatinivorum]|uniref:Uncharacterized protein n=1 Tax=Leucosporidium creatinivorum TaxID=106004 RepID=A0A1Y2FWN0_9BASI|nr:hypothetical protein BCR35DRAFT_301539 [Leucosporidium creatinivorum]
MTPLRRSSPSPSPRPSPSTSTTDIRTPAAPSQPPPIPHPKSSPSILRHPAPLEVSASSDVAEGGGAALRRRRTDRRPHQLDVEGVEKVETVVHEHLIEEVDLAQPPSLGGRRLAVSALAFSFASRPLADWTMLILRRRLFFIQVTNPDRRSSPPSPIADSLGGGVRSPSPSAS